MLQDETYLHFLFAGHEILFLLRRGSISISIYLTIYLPVFKYIYHFVCLSNKISIYLYLNNYLSIHIITMNPSIFTFHLFHLLQGVHQILRFFEDFNTYSGLCFPSVSVCGHTPGRQNTSAAAELAELRKLKKFKEKYNI